MSFIINHLRIQQSSDAVCSISYSAHLVKICEAFYTFFKKISDSINGSYSRHKPIFN